MQKDKQDGHRCHKAQAEQEKAKEATAQRAPVGKLVAHQLLRHIPT